MAGFVNAPNRVPDNQRKYQAAYNAHTRLWKIGPRSSVLVTPFVVVLWGTCGICLYGMGRKVAGFNSFFGKD